jgi:hypothetical protein
MVSVTLFINMDESFFKKLSPQEANEFLRQFLEVESRLIKETIKQCAAQGIKMDYSVKSILPFLRWVATKMRTTSKEPDPVAPEWLCNHPVYTKHLFDFDEPSGMLITRAGYYMGESFVRTFGNLRWGIGDEHERIKTSEKNMPVVTGFHVGTEMPPVLIVENILREHVSDPKSKRIKVCIETWCGQNEAPIKI